jgi:hypothetical protein
VTPLHLLLAGALALLGGVAILRTFGPGYRIGRTLASTPPVSVAEAIRLAGSGTHRYVRIDGRIDADEPFEDAEHRPLVLRRTVLEAHRDGRWSAFETGVEAVAFGISEGLETIAVDAADIDAGLVVVPRRSEGIVGDLADRAPDDLPDQLPARVTVRHVSSVEHASVLGVPRRGADGVVTIGPGLGRPLILTTLEIPEAMRILAQGASVRPRLAAAALIVGGALLVAGLAWGAAQAASGWAVPPTVSAASPDATAPAAGSDTRSAGQGPGLVGDPGAALLAVGAITLLTVVATQAWIRMTRGRPGPG